MSRSSNQPADRAGRYFADLEAQVFAEPIPTPPDWDQLSPHQQQTYRDAVIAYAIAAIANQRGVTPRQQLSIWRIGA